MQISITKNQKEKKDHGNYAFPVNICIESIQAYDQGTFPLHWHPEVELTLILSGMMEYRVNDDCYILKEGDGLFGNSNTLHAGHCIGRQECRYLSVTFHPRFLYGYEGSILQSKYLEYITENTNWPSVKIGDGAVWEKEAKEWLEMILELSKEQPPDYEMQVQMKLLQIWQALYLYFKALPEEEQKPQKHLQRLRGILSFIHENYTQEIGLCDIADHVSICKSECCRFFKKHMHMTIFEYILYYRIQKSLPMLKSGESVTEVSWKVGFSSPAYFGQVFKRYIHCTPKEYQKSAHILL